MALSRRELNAAKRGKRDRRGLFGPASPFAALRSNATAPQAGQPFAAGDNGSMVAGITVARGAHAASQPRRAPKARNVLMGAVTAASPITIIRMGEFD